MAGADEAYRQIKHVRDRIPKAMQAAVLEGLTEIFLISQGMVPVQHGDLKETGTLHPITDTQQHDRLESQDRWTHTGGVTYGDPSRLHSRWGTPIDYAVPVREDTKAHHAVGHAFYLKLAVIEASSGLLEKMGKKAAQELVGYLAGAAKPFGRRVEVPVGPLRDVGGGRVRQQYQIQFKPERMELLGGDLYKGMTMSGLPSRGGGWADFTRISQDIMDQAGRVEMDDLGSAVTGYLGYGSRPTAPSVGKSRRQVDGTWAAWFRIEEFRLRRMVKGEKVD